LSRNESQEKKGESWTSEFKTLGVEGVRREILLGRWPQRKIAAAKQWLQLEDVRQWQQRSPVSRERSPLRLKQWAQYIAIAFAVLYAAARLFRMMRQGM
jgi:hypothetical protein